MNEVGIALDFTKGLQLLKRFHALNESSPKATLNSTLQEHKQSCEPIKAQSKYNAFIQSSRKVGCGGGEEGETCASESRFVLV